METIWVLARNQFTATEALRKNLKDHSAFKENFVAFRFIATADQVRSLPGNQKFIVVQHWRERKDADQVLKAIRENEWVYYSLKDLFLYG